MDWPIQTTLEEEPSVGLIVESETQPRIRPSLGDSSGDWLCAWCLNRVAHDKDRFCFDGRSAFSFRNPQGIQFNILTFSTTIGCRTTGVPTLEHTWFPGHAWSFCRCAECGTHLGWQYTGPSEFAGLIQDRIVRALPLRN